MPLEVTQIVLWTLLVVVVIPVSFLVARRRWLSRLGGIFECSVRLPDSTPSSGWTLGVARYQGEQLEWFRTFSWAFRPHLTFPRSDTVAGAQREPSPDEAERLFAGQRIVALAVAGRARWELAMAPGSLMGLMSWLEAAPPGLQYRVPESKL